MVWELSEGVWGAAYKGQRGQNLANCNSINNKTELKKRKHRGKVKPRKEKNMN